LYIAVSEAEQCLTEEVDRRRDCQPDVGRCPAIYGAYCIHQHALVCTGADVYLALFAVDGTRAVGSCRRRSHGANDSNQCTHR